MTTERFQTGAGSDAGRRRRIATLLGHQGFFCWLAADHGLTFGPVDGLRTFDDLERLARLPAISGVIVNPGTAARLSSELPTPLIIQTFGYPSPDGGPEGKIPIATPEQATRLGATAIAVELNLSVSDLTQSVEAVSRSVADACRLGLPVLIMMAPGSTDGPANEIARAIRVATELGADFVKIGLPDSASAMSDNDRDTVETAVRNSPPVVLAGGPGSAAIQPKLRLAALLGFAGVCVGRHLFGSAASAVLDETTQAFTEYR